MPTIVFRVCNHACTVEMREKRGRETSRMIVSHQYSHDLPKLFDWLKATVDIVRYFLEHLFGFHRKYINDSGCVLIRIYLTSEQDDK